MLPRNCIAALLALLVVTDAFAFVQPHLTRAGPLRPVVPAVLCVTADGGGSDGGGSGGSGFGDGGGGGDGGDDDGDEEVDVTSMLSDAGLETDQLPNDLMDALKSRRIGPEELSNYKSVLGSPLTRALATSAYIRCRLISEPRLTSVLAIEIFVGCLSTLAAEKAARGDAFRKELDFVLANQVLIVLTNVALVLALTPTAAVAAPPAAGTLGASFAALPGFFAQQGPFTAAQRAACFVSKALQFSAIGSLTSGVGQAVTISLVTARTHMDPDNAPTVQLAPVLPTASAYAVFMAASSNTRYQIVNTIEARYLSAVPGGASAQTIVSFLVRTYNNYLGSSNWIWWAKYRGLQ